MNINIMSLMESDSESSYGCSAVTEVGVMLLWTVKLF